MEGVHDAIARLVDEVHGRRVAITRMREVPNVRQGASGSEVRVYTVHLKGGVPSLHVATKNATFLERQVLHYLKSVQAAIPPHSIDDIHGPDRSIVAMLRADLQPSHHGRENALTCANANALANLHFRTLYHRPTWLPEGTQPNLYLEPWRDVWHENLELSDFAREFGPYTDRLDAQFQRFWCDYTAICKEAGTVCLVNADLHPDHRRLCQGKVCFIDWEQARLAPFYLDIVNYFTKETVLTYRDSLATLGHEIPVMDFLDRFHAMGRYMGFRYLEVGLNAWRNRRADWPAQRAFLYFCLELALNGR